MGEQEQTSFSLDELSQESGFDTRVIRSFIEQGLMRGPTTLGRYARYSRQHLERLQAIKVLKEKQGLRVVEVRQQLLAMSDAEIAALAETGSTLGAQQPEGSALDYIRQQSDLFLEPYCEPELPTSVVSEEKPKSKPKTLANSIREKLGFKVKEPAQHPVNPPEPRPNLQNQPAASAPDSVSKGDASNELSIPASKPLHLVSPMSLADSVREKIAQSSAQAVAEEEALAAERAARLAAQSKYESPWSDGRDAETDEDDSVAQDLSEYWAPATSDEQRSTKDRILTPFDRLAHNLKEQVGGRTVRRQAKKEVWHRIPVTPDIELSVRGIHDEQQLARLERVADYLRELLTGGSYD